MPDWLASLFKPDQLQALVAVYGLWVMAPIIFAETGLLVGFFLPGDSLLFLAGAVCAMTAGTEAALDPVIVSLVLVVAAVAGNSLNYWLGRQFGEWAWNRPDGRLLKRRYLDEAHAFYARYGAVSLVLTRYIPVLRTFVPFVAGAARMPFATYTVWNAVGAVCWVSVLVALGWWLGSVPFVKRHIELILIGVIIISVMPMIVAGLWRWWASRARTVGSATETSP